MITSVHKKRVVVISVVVVCMFALVFVFLQNRSTQKFEYEGWINCMPVLDSKQSELCQQAEEANYPYIAY
jgi:hypothetical protein